MNFRALFPLMAMVFVSHFTSAAMQTGRAGREEKASSPQNGGIVFVGSSIFQFWTHLVEQMEPLPVLNRAIAGTVTQDMLDGIDPFALRYHPRIVVYYCGSNDISSGESAAAIIKRTQRFVQILHQQSPNTVFYYTAIQKAPEKRSRWNVVEQVNREMERYTRETDKTGFIDLNPTLFDAQGKLREDLFLPDRLHFRPDSSAYLEFSRIVKPILMRAWESGAGTTKNQ